MKKNNHLILAIALIFCLVSGIGASLVQTSGGHVTIKDMRWETESGQLLSALLFVPDTATEANPAPAIVVSHGWYNTREMQDLNYVEYTRRGYVVVAIDMYGHGNSDAVTPEEWMENGTGLYDAVLLLSQLPYVNANQIGITGHSNGARAANLSVLADDAHDKQLVSSVLLVANDPMYTSSASEPLFWMAQPAKRDYTNRYGQRDVGVIAAQFDEFFFRSMKATGGWTLPQDYIHTEAAQSFLSFGETPEGEEKKIETFYQQQINGQTANRVIYTPYQTHPWNHFSATCVKNGVQFFEKTLPAPNPIDANNQIWQWKVLFNALGLIGFLMFIISFARFLLGSHFFQSLKTPTPVTIRPAGSRFSKIWFWVSQIIITLISGLSYLFMQVVLTGHQPSWLPQEGPYFIGVWSAFMGIIVIISLILSYYVFAKKEGLDLQANGLKMNAEAWGKTILLSLTIVFSAFLLVFLADYFFLTDFRIWVLTVKAFNADKIGIALRYLPFFLLFYIPNSIAINAFNYVSIGKKEWINTAILALFNGLSLIIIVIVNYALFFAKGEQVMLGGISILGIWAIPIAIILPLAAIASRKLYRMTNNPYLAGLVNAMIVTLISCTNTLTTLIK